MVMDEDISFDFEESLPIQHAGGVRPVQAQTSRPVPGEQGRALAVVDNTASTSGRHFRQTVCTYWLKGLCMKGEDCGFLHEFDTARMPVCRNLVRYGECRDTDCPFKHAMDDLKECNMYKLGFCVYGAQCRYRHTRVPGPPPDPSTLDAVRPRHTRPGGWGEGPYVRRQEGSGPRPPAAPRPSAADLSSGRVAEPQQLQRPQQPAMQTSNDDSDHDHELEQQLAAREQQHQQQQHLQQQQQLQQQHMQQHFQQQQGGMAHGQFPGMGFQQPMQMMGMPFGMPFNMQHQAGIRPFGMSGPMGPMLGPGVQGMGPINPMQMQMQMMRPQFMPQQGMPFHF